MLEEKEDNSNLWFNVIVQALIDITTEIDFGKQLINKNNAMEWLDVENEKFVFVCELANLNPLYVIRIKNKILKENIKIRVLRNEKD